MHRLATVILFFTISEAPVLAAQGADNPSPSPPTCVEDERLRQRSLGAFRRDIRRLQGATADGPAPRDAYSNCVLAELLKRVGDGRAEHYYRKAIAAEAAEPEYELVYADYLRNFRGPRRPLFPQAERHYVEALRKFRRLPAGTRRSEGYERLRTRIERGLIALYQEDGLPILHKADRAGGEPAVERPVMFFSTSNRAARSVGDFERVDEVRSFTSEALFAASRQRLGRPLSAGELTGLIRPKRQFETLNRVRFRNGDWPVVDVFHRHREIDDAQITNFFRPGEFNDFRLREFGAAVEKTFDASPYFDLSLRGLYKRSERRGLIEFLPGSKERLNHFEANAAASRFAGPDKVTLEAIYLYQDINPDTPNPPERHRRIVAATLTYQMFRPIPLLDSVYGERFRPRGLHLFGGAAFDTERFGSVDIKKQDFFIGSSARGLGRVDLTLQPTFFKARVTGDATQSHSQYRTNFNLLYRALDEESEPGLPEERLGARWAFVHLGAAFKHDVALKGLKDFENFDAGVQLDTKFFIAGRRRTTFLTSLRYNYQQFYRLNKNLNLFAFDISMGF